MFDTQKYDADIHAAEEALKAARKKKTDEEARARAEAQGQKQLGSDAAALDAVSVAVAEEEGVTVAYRTKSGRKARLVNSIDPDRVAPEEDTELRALLFAQVDKHDLACAAMEAAARVVCEAYGLNATPNRCACLTTGVLKNLFGTKLLTHKTRHALKPILAKLRKEQRK